MIISVSGKGSVLWLYALAVVWGVLALNIGVYADSNPHARHHGQHRPWFATVRPDSVQFSNAEYKVCFYISKDAKGKSWAVTVGFYNQELNVTSGLKCVPRTSFTPGESACSSITLKSVGKKITKASVKSSGKTRLPLDKVVVTYRRKEWTCDKNKKTAPKHSDGVTDYETTFDCSGSAADVHLPTITVMAVSFILWKILM